MDIRLKREALMRERSFVDESRERDAYTAVKEFIEDVTSHEAICGRKMNTDAKHFSHDIAAAVINAIKSVNAVNTDDALKYGMIKTGISYDRRDERKCRAHKNVLKILDGYNGDNKTILNKQAGYTILAEDKLFEIKEMKKGLTFTQADLTFDFRTLMGAYPSVTLFEGTSAIRTYKKTTGEERALKYEVLSGLGRILTLPEKMVYTAMDVKDCYIYHHDSAHGWLEVPAGEIKAMGLEKRISPYSYSYQDKVYLEEDLDVGTFINIRKLLSKPISIQNSYLDGMCYIRDYPHYRPEVIMPRTERTARKTPKSRDPGWER
jgi:hypothetical protein